MGDYRMLFQADNPDSARCMARKISTLLEVDGFLEASRLPGHVLVAVAALLGQERKRLVAACTRAGLNSTLLAIERMGNFKVSELENLLDAAMEAFPHDSGMAALCIKKNILFSRYEGEAKAKAFEEWLKHAGDSATLKDVYKLFRICHEPKVLRRAPIAAIRDAMDRAACDGLAGPERVLQAMSACDFGDMYLAEKILAGLPSNERGLDAALERVSGLRETLDWLADEVHEAINSFWETAAAARDPLEAVRSRLRKESDKVAILMPYGQAAFGRKVMANHAWVPEPKTMNFMRIIKATIRILRKRGQKYRIHMWPWPLGKNPPLAGHVRTLAFHAFATEADTRTVFHKGSHVPDTCLIDSGGYSGWSSLRHLTRDDIRKLDDAPHEREAFFRFLHEKYIDANYSVKQQPTSNDAMIPDDHVFLATQMPDDSVQALAWIDQMALISETIRWAESSGRTLVIKRHPLCRDMQVTRLLDRKLPANVHVINAPIHDLIKRARAVVVGNSGVGFESLMHGKLVITVASSDYQLATRTARTLEKLHELLDSMDSLPDDSDFIRAFVHVYLKKLVIDPSDDKAVETALSHQFERTGWWDE